MNDLLELFYMPKEQKLAKRKLLAAKRRRDREELLQLTEEEFRDFQHREALEKMQKGRGLLSEAAYREKKSHFFVMGYLAGLIFFAWVARRFGWTNPDSWIYQFGSYFAVLAAALLGGAIGTAFVQINFIVDESTSDLPHWFDAGRHG